MLARRLRGGLEFLKDVGQWAIGIGQDRANRRCELLVELVLGIRPAVAECRYRGAQWLGLGLKSIQHDLCLRLTARQDRLALLARGVELQSGNSQALAGF